MWADPMCGHLLSSSCSSKRSKSVCGGHGLWAWLVDRFGDRQGQSNVDFELNEDAEQ